MKLATRRFDLALAHRWAISRSVPDQGGSRGTDIFKVIFAELTDADGTCGIGEAAPSARYQENAESVLAFLARVDPDRLSFDDVPGSMARMDKIAPGNFAAKCAINIALLDGAARRAGRPVCEHLGLGFREGRHITSFSIGIDSPEMIRRKVREAAPYPVLKLKVGGPDDRENLAALREAAPDKPVRVDANEGWKTREEALAQIEWLAADGRIELVEQPMPAASAAADWAWLKARSPLPIMADESYRSAADIAACADGFHAVNVKLVKTGGISAARAALEAARKAGLKTMLGCMIESSVLITAAAHLAELTDYLDLDGNLLITNDPYRGVTATNGILSFVRAPAKTGLQLGPAMEV